MHTSRNLVLSLALFSLTGTALAAGQASVSQTAVSDATQLTAQDHRRGAVLAVDVADRHQRITDYRMLMRAPDGSVHAMNFKAMPLGTHNG